jgi:hypothetical protein
MSLLHPALLILLPLAGVPLVLHLLVRRRAQVVEIATFRFLLDGYVRKRHRLHFRDLMLAVLRAAFVGALVLVICRPVITQWPWRLGTVSGREQWFLVDCSASMAVTTSGLSSLERAKAAARAMIDQMEPVDQIAIVAVTNRSSLVFQGFRGDGSRTRRALDSLRTSATRANFYAALSAQLHERHSPTTVHIFTDCQANSWEEIKRQGTPNLLPADSQLAVIDVGGREPISNVSIHGAAPLERPIVGVPLEMTAQVRNHTDGAVDALIALSINEEEVCRLLLHLPARQETLGRFPYTPRASGVHQCRFELISPRDHFAADDVYRFTLDVSPRIGVVLVDGSTSADPASGESLYLRTALGTLGERSAPGSKGAGPLALQEIKENGMKPEALAGADLVILADCGAIGSYRSGLLHDFVMAGGGLLVFPGDHVNPTQFNTEFLTAAAGPQNEELSPVRLGMPAGELDNFDKADRLISFDLSHPALRAFKDNGHVLQTAVFFRRFRLTVEKNGSNCRILAEFADHSPAIVEGHLGAGTVIILGFSAAPGWTNLPLKPDFVPFLIGLINHARRGPAIETPAAVAAGGSAEIRTTTNWRVASAELIDPEGRQTPLKFERHGPRLETVTDNTQAAGYYIVSVKPAGLEAVSAGFAVNPAVEESDFTMLSEPEIHALVGNVDFRFFDASAKAQERYGSRSNDREVWPLMVLILFVLLIGELVLATPGHGRPGGKLLARLWPSKRSATSES